MKVAFIASEAVPFAKTGGLADVAGALPRFLGARGAEVTVFLPLYGTTRERAREFSLSKTSDHEGLDWNGARVPFALWESRREGFTARFIERDEYFKREGLYGTTSGDFPDNGERFGFFCLAALEAMKTLSFRPDIVHAHDWQSALSLACLKHRLSGDEFFKGSRSLFTIHNLAYQGLFPREILRAVGLPEKLFHHEEMEFYGRVSFLKAGILYASAVNTVSPTYSREIQTPEFGCGLEGLLRHRSRVLSGILNGVDYSNWDPAEDRHIAARYTRADLRGKEVCKADLLRAFGLPAGDRSAPVIGMVTRLAGQKGLDILAEALDDLFREKLRLVILGQGEPALEKRLAEAAAEHPGAFGLRLGFDETLAHKIYAGSDLFLIPSRYEPCGLTQMYSLKYGTVPLVRATGGLDDTVEEFDPETLQGNGVKFHEHSAAALIEAVRRALRLHGRKELWAALVRSAMACDFSWNRSAGEYMDLYGKILSAP
ncbi:MAG: starch synthase [Candidatus Aminicenantes bacterium RBG_13_63_10]|nr:MAG: starch synthase [Candidatus Aminicenantes bacterium RBG_13_63_10]